MHNRSFGSLVITKLLGFFIFLFMIYLGNLLVGYFNNPIYSALIEFVDRNLSLLIMMSFVFMLSDIFYAIIFPLSLVAPIFSAIGSMFLVTLIIRIILMIDNISDQNISSPVRILSFMIYPLVFILVLIGGYVSVFVNLVRSITQRAQKHEEKKEKIVEMKRSNAKSWKDIGEEFRQLIYDFLTMLRKTLTGKK